MDSRSAGILGVERADWPLAGAGAVLALGLTVAAGAMILRADKRPLVNGADHLALFARPAQIHEERLRAQATPEIAATAVPARTSPTPAATPAIDFAPTASIAPSPPLTVGAPTTATGYRLVRASRGHAVFRGPTGEINVRRGGIVPGVGRVTAIRAQGKAWTVVLGPANPVRANPGAANTGGARQSPRLSAGPKP